MRVLKMSLALVFGFTATLASASIVPTTAEVVEASLEANGSNVYTEGYVQLNKTAQTISLILQPTMPACATGRICAAVMPAPSDYYFEAVGKSVDACNAVTWSAEQTVGKTIKVRVIDNTQYDYDRCPTFAPLADTVVEVQQTILSTTGTERFEELLTGESLATVRF